MKELTKVRTLKQALLALAGASVLLAGPALGQRRVIAPPGVKVPAAEPKVEQPKPEEPKPEQAGPEEKVPAAATATPEGDQGRRAVAPVAPVAPPKPDEPPPPPKILVPRDEASAPAKKDPKAPVIATGGPREAVYRKKIDKAIVTLRVRPGQPSPNRTATLSFEIVRLLAVPDPAIGDRMPEENALLSVAVTQEGKGLLGRYRLHATKDAGVYAMHLVVPEAAQYRIQLAQRLEKAEIGDKPIEAEFLLGIGQATEMQAAEEETAVKAGRGRTALKAVDPQSGAPAASQGMRALGDEWVDLSLALDDASSTSAELETRAKAIVELSARTAGQVPGSMAAHSKEFDGLAAQLKIAVDPLPGAMADRAKAATTLAKIRDEQCTRCHTRFRHHLTEDVSNWPRFTVKPSKTDQPRR